MNEIVFLIICCWISTIRTVPAAKNHTCIQYSELSIREYDYDEFTISPTSELQSSENFQEPEIVQCQVDFNFCFAIWTIDQNGTKYVKKQGCWQENADKNIECLQEDCIGTLNKNNIYYCCCEGRNCNKNMTAIERAEPAEGVKMESTRSPVSYSSEPVWLFSIFLTFIAFLFFTLFILIFYITCHHRPQKSRHSETAPLSPSGPGYSSNLQNVDNLKVISKIGQGKFGTVWKGMVNEQEVAVKIFPSHHKQYFINERNVYSLPLMNVCPSVLEYFGCDERRTLDGHMEFFLVLSLAPLGCLQDWLMENIPNYSVFCKMSKTICRGLSHLHTEIQHNNELKPCICHRDLNSRNILVKSDLSCCLADFGFALKTYGSKYEYKGEIAYAETKSISEVGTLRYMAPEILEGAVNLRDCETALKQIDVYSLGLVLWEVSVRCEDLYPQGQSVPLYRAPYEAEIGKHPTFEQMQVLVARHKARPLFPPGWGCGQACKITRDTCEDCWDHDAEARLTALCAEERMQELVNLRPRSNATRGPSPPLSANNLISSTADSKSQTSLTNHNTNFNTNCINQNTIITPPNQQIGETESTVVSLTSPTPGIEKNHFIFPQQIQPYQGRNPCLERNLAPQTGNRKQNQVFIEKSKKHSFLENRHENSLSCLEDDVSVEDLISNHNSNKLIEETSIMGEGFKKQNNVDKKLKGWHGVRALIQKKLFRKDSNSLLNQIRFNDEKSNLVDNRLLNSNINQANSPTKDITVNFIDGCVSNKSHSIQNGNVNNIIETSGSSTSSRRPSNLDLQPITVRVNGISPENNKSNLKQNISAASATTDKQSAINKTALASQHALLIRDTPRLVLSQSANTNLNHHSSSENNIDEKQITRQRSLEMFKEVFTAKGSTERLRDPSQRVKTPGDVPASVRKIRASKTLSLYDDRMMDLSGIL